MLLTMLLGQIFIHINRQLKEGNIMENRSSF